MITIEQSKDYEIVSNILLSDGIREVAEDGFNDSNIIEIIDSSMWFVAYDDETPIGVYQVKQLGASLCEMHANFIKTERGVKPSACIKPMQTKMIELGFNKYICTVPIIYPNVISYCKKCGFSLEGINRQSYLKNKQFIDQAMLGITRLELESIL